MTTISTTITSTVTLSTGGTYQSPLTIANNGAIETTGVNVAIYGPNTQAWSVYNDAGTVDANGADGIALDDGGSVSNAAGGYIAGFEAGVYVKGAAGTVGNSGTILGQDTAIFTGDGVYLKDGGTVTNASGGYIWGHFYGVKDGFSGAASVNNSGTIVSDGEAVSEAHGGTVVNSGAAALISAYNTGIYLVNATGSVNNSGSIIQTSTRYGAGVLMASGGSDSLYNAASGEISGYRGVLWVDANGTITNAGTIETGDRYGIDIEQSSHDTVINSGTIEATGGGSTGIRDVEGSGLTVVNSGTISGTDDAIYFYGGTNRLVVDQGAVFYGTVTGGGTNTLELAATTSEQNFSGLGTQFLDFSSIVVDAGGDWDFTSDGTIAGGVTLTDNGSLSNSGYIGSTVTLGADAYFYNASGGDVYLPGNAIHSAASGVSVVNAGTVDSTIANGIALDDGGSVSNAAGGYIAGFEAGVYVKGAAGTVGNSGTISGYGHIADSGAGVYLQGGGHVTNAVSGYILGYNTGVYVTGAAGTVYNSGLIEGSGYLGAGVDLAGGGSVTNAYSGEIQGYYYGVKIAGATGSVANSGVIAGTIANGVELDDGGSVTNTYYGYIGGRRGDGIYVEGAAGTITNDGVIRGHSAGVDLADGGSVTNTYTGEIRGTFYGVKIAGSASVDNSGLIAGTIADGIELDDGGSVTNTYYGSIGGGGDGIYVKGAAGTIANDGVIGGYGRFVGGAGVYLADGGSVTNTYSGEIRGSYYGVQIAGSASVGNYGTIIAAIAGVQELDGGTVVNSGAGALIGGYYFGVYVAGAASVNNSGTIEDTGAGGIGVYLIDGGTVANNGTAASISGGQYGIKLTGAAGTVTNSGTIAGTGGDGVLFSGGFDDTLIDYGTVEGASGFDAVQFGGGDDRLVVHPGAVFTGTVDGGGGYNTIELASAATTGTLTNLGSQFVNFADIAVDPGASWVIDGATGGGTLRDGGTLVNNGTISGFTGVTLDPSTLINNGYVSVPVALGSGSYLGNTGTISMSGGTAVTGTGSSITVSNNGTIATSGGDAVQLLGSNNRLIAAPRAVFSGLVDGGGGALELASAANTGTISGLGTSFIDFATVTVDAGASWALSGSNTLSGTIANGATLELLSSAVANGTIDFAGARGSLRIDDAPSAPNFAIGATITGFAAGDTIDLAGIALDPNGRAILLSGNVLQVTETGVTFDLQFDPSQSFAGRFVLSSDGNGGTDIGLGGFPIPSPPPPPATYPSFGLDWSVAGVGDVNGDGAADIVWTNGAGNLTQIEFQIAGVPIGGGVIANNVFDAGWEVSAAGDFNGDGLTDLVYRRVSDGLTEIQLLHGLNAIGGGAIANNPFDASWNIVTTGDFNGDGNSDLVWQRPTDGLTEIQFLNGATPEGGGVIPNNPFGQDWKIVTAGDFTSNGKDDLVWQNQFTGLVELQFMDGITPVGGGAIPNNPFGVGWNVVGAGDFLGNGFDDLVYQRQSDGLVEIQYLKGLNAVGGGVVNTSFGAAWQMVGVGDFNGDGMADLLYRNTATQTTEVQLLNGLIPSGGGRVAFGQ